MKSILVTSIGGDIAQSIINVIRTEYPGVFLIGTDSNEQPFFSKLVDEFCLVPPANMPQFENVVNEIISRFAPDIFIPVSEPEIKFFSENSFPDSSTRVLIPNSESVAVGLDKFLTYEFIMKLGDYAPMTCKVWDDGKLKFPVISKPIDGRGSKDILICEDMDDIRYVQRKLPKNIFQEILTPSDQEITCAVYRSNSTETRVLQLRRRLSGGRTSWAQVVLNSDVENLCRTIAGKLELSGPMNIQLILTASGPKVFEINPRYSSTVQLRHTMGFQDLCWGIQDCLGIPLSEFNPIPLGLIGGKTDAIQVLEGL